VASALTASSIGAFMVAPERAAASIASSARRTAASSLAARRPASSRTWSRSTSWPTRRISSSSVTEPVWQLTPTTRLAPFSSALWYWKADSAISPVK
jgi:hypothetical protein